MPRAGPTGLRLRSIVLVGLLILAGLGTSPVLTPAAPTGGGLLASVPGAADPEEVLITITVEANGDATWQVRYAFELEDDNATAAFADLEADIEADPATYRSRFTDRMGEIATTAESVTGRSMTITNSTVTANTDPFTTDQGFVTYRFTWTAFAATDGGDLLVGDAIDGLFLTQNTTLTVTWPSTYDATAVRPAADERKDTGATWTGERNFGPGEPRVELTRPPDAGGQVSGPTSGNPGILSDLSTPAVLGLGLVGILAVVGAAWHWRSHWRGLRGWRQPGHAEATRGRPADELLSNEERVIAVLERHGGRAKQQDIVESTGWSEVKTSEVVGELRERGVIEGFRLGRENVLSLPDDTDI